MPVVRTDTRWRELRLLTAVGEGERVHGPHGAGRLRAVGQDAGLDLQPGAEDSVRTVSRVGMAGLESELRWGSV